jgi:4'-phosphopantetheinyl transferase
VTDDTFREAPAIGPAPWTVDVWSAALDPPGPLLSLLRDQLSAEEHGRARRFVRDRDRDRFVAGRAFLRLLLGRCLGEDPRAFVFRHGPNGKPELEGPPRGLAFNLAHSEARAVCAVARGCDALGVDVERVRPIEDAEGVARLALPRGEAARLASLPEPQRRRAFYEAWTRNEALLKALGLGLGQPLDHRAAGERLSLQAFELEDDHVGAVAVAGRGWGLRIRAWGWEGVVESDQ